jgi:hypothetical protein
MSTGAELKKLGTRSAYPASGRVEKRWGQILREPVEIRRLLEDSQAAELLVPLVDVAEVVSGLVTRANAYFVVRELPFEGIPARFGITKRDSKRIAVVEDGLGTLQRIERIALRPIVKGPESLVAPSEVAESDLRVFDCGDRSKTELRQLRANGAVAYLRRGETVGYKVSEDRLKGGVPAQRSNIKNRKPYWYSLHAPKSSEFRLAVPEHFGSRFIATLIPPDEDLVVIDTLYSVRPREGVRPDVLLASLNSLLTWYQLELRGRTQHGEGVLKVKLADWDGVLVLNGARLGDVTTQALLDAFEPLRTRPTLPVAEELARPDRQTFDRAYLKLCGAPDAEGARLALERELRAGIGERHQRAHSVDEARASRPMVKRATASVDAFASRIAAQLEPFPDPRTFTEKEGETLILIATPFEGPLRVGDDLFTQGDVFAGEDRIASAGEPLAAQFVRGVLLHDPELTAVNAPEGKELERAVALWDDAIRVWQARFDEVAKSVLGSVADDRLQIEIRTRARALLHAH